MNVLLLTDYYPPDKIGGVGEIARRLGDAYRARGHRVFVLTTGTRREEEERAGIHRSSRSLLAGVLLNNLRALRLLRRERIDLVHLHQSSTTLFLLARPFLRTFPFVLDSLQVSYLSEAREIRPVTAGGRRFRPRPAEYLERFLLAPGHVLLDLLGYLLSDRVTVVSQDNRQELERSYGRIARRPVEVVPNGVPAEPEADAPGNGSGAARAFSDPSLEARIGGRVVLVYVGVFRTRKRVPNLLLALARVVERRPETVLLLVGGGRGYEEEIARLARDLGIERHVEMVGKTPPARVPYYLSLADVFCILSSYEGMPVALLEAMAMGKAVVATDGYGMRDLLADGAAGVLVPVDDVPATARALEALVGDADRREALGRSARARVREHYGWDGVAARYLALVGRR